MKVIRRHKSAGRLRVEQLENRRLLTGAAHSDLIESLSPVGYWRLSEFSGVEALDNSGVSSGVYRNGVSLGVDGVLAGDGAAAFDGIDDIIEIPHDDAYLLAEGSLGIWFNADSVSGSSGIVSKDSKSKDTGGHLSVLIQDGALRVRSQSTTHSKDLYSPSGSLTSDTWHHAVVTWGRPGMSLYLDGNLSVNDPDWTTGLNINLEPIVVGGLQWMSGNFVADVIDNPWKGKIDEFAIFDQVLSAQQIESLYASATGGVPENNPPIAVDDFATTSDNTPVTIENVLINDSDIDGDPISVTSYDSISAQGGFVTHDGGGTFNYSPPLNVHSDDSFGYEIGDGRGGAGSARVNIILIAANNPPVALDDTATTTVDTPVTIDNVLANDSDFDGDNIAVASFDSTSVEGGSVMHIGNGTFLYLPPSGFTSADSFRYEVSDGKGGTDTANVSISVIAQNDPPVAADDIATTSEDTAVAINNVLANDSDGDGDSISVTSFDSVSVQGGTVTHDGNGSFHYTPPLNFNSDDRFSYQIGDGKGGVASATVHITVAARNDAPDAVDDFATTSEDTLVMIQNVLSNDFDVDGDTIRLTNFDLVSAQGGMVSLGGIGSFNYTPPPGFTSTDSFSYQIGDGKGGTDTATVNISVIANNNPPVAMDDTTATDEDTPVAIDNVLANDLDVDGDTITVTSFDGVSAQGGSVTYNGNGNFDYMPPANFHSTDSFTYQIGDGRGGTDTATINIVVAPVNDVPMAIDDTAATSEDTSVTIDNVLANDLDVDGDAITVTSFDGVSTQGGSITHDGHGTFNYTPPANFHSTDSFTYRIGDGSGETDSATINIVVAAINDIPVAVDDSATTSEDTTVEIGNVLANDLDVDGDTITVTGFDAVSVQGGSVTHDGHGTFSYTPPPNFNSADSFTYQIGDGHGGVDTATVNISVAGHNDAPRAVDDTATTSEDTPITIANVLSNDSDEDGDAINVTSFDRISVQGGEVTHHGGGTFDYIPPPNFNSVDSFSYQIGDGNGGVDTATVNISIAARNDLPVALDDSTSTSEDTPVVISNVLILSNDSDVDGDTISISSFDGVSVHGGSVTQNGDGTFTYAPPSNFNSDDSFGYQISDGNGGFGTAKVNISVAARNDPPVAVDDTATTSKGTPVTISNVLFNDSDVDGDTLRISSFDSVSAEGGAITHDGNGTFNYSPPADIHSHDNFSYQIGDGNGGVDTATVNINITSEFETSYSDLVFELDPVSYWRFRELSGTVAMDEIGVSSGVYEQGIALGNDGVLTGETAVQFDGSGNIVEIPHDDAYLLDEGSLGIWFNAESISGTSGIVSKDSRSKDTGGHLSLLIQDGVLRVRSQSSTQTRDLNSRSGLLTTDNWHFVVVTWGASGMSVYLDGELSVNDAAWTTGLTVNLEPIVVGALQWRSGDLIADNIEHPFLGKIDEFAIFDQVLNTGQIQSLYARATGGAPPNNRPVAVDDNATTSENTPVIIDNVLANDFDVDEDTIMITSFDQTSAEGGSVASNGDGTFNYTPPPNFTSFDSFSYQIGDGKGGTDVATVNISVIPSSGDGLNVFAGFDRSVSILPWNRISLNANIRGSQGSVAVNWSVLSDPDGIYLEDSQHAATDVVFETAGIHTFRITVTDDVESVFDDISIDVTQPTARIAPFGDSITQANTNQASYRRPLWHELQNLGYDVDFVGSSQSNHNGPNPFNDFDLDHEGHWGSRADEVASNLPRWLQGYTPDIVLLHIGHNDLKIDSNLQNTLDDTAQIITDLRADNPNVAILLATLIPSIGSPRDVRIPLYNDLLPGFAETMNTPDSPVLLVDQFSGFDADLHTYDGIHPNEAGEELMADRWLRAINDLFEPSDVFGSNHAAAAWRMNSIKSAIDQRWLKTREQFPAHRIPPADEDNEFDFPRRTLRGLFFYIR